MIVIYKRKMLFVPLLFMTICEVTKIYKEMNVLIQKSK